MSDSLEDWLFTDHALGEMTRRGIELELVETILVNPEQRLNVRPGRDVLQSRISVDGVQYLIRVFVDVDRAPAEIVTVYRMSKLFKYWSTT